MNMHLTKVPHMGTSDPLQVAPNAALLIDFDNFYNQVQESRTHNLSPEEQVESIYNLSWTVIQQVVNIIQPVQHEL